jgi:hypothetical protein
MLGFHSISEFPISDIARPGGTSFSGTPAVSSLLKTGQIPTLTRGFVFTPGVASLVKTGQVPALTRPFIGTPAAASLLKTGQVPVLTISGVVVAAASLHSWFVKGIGIKTKIVTNSQVDSDTGDTP